MAATQQEDLVDNLFVVETLISVGSRAYLVTTESVSRVALHRNADKALTACPSLPCMHACLSFCLCQGCGFTPAILPSHLEPVLNYLVEEYRADIAGYNVTHSVHVEACWPDDPVNETRYKKKATQPSNEKGFRVHIYSGGPLRVKAVIIAHAKAGVPCSDMGR